MLSLKGDFWCFSFGKSFWVKGTIRINQQLLVSKIQWYWAVGSHRCCQLSLTRCKGGGVNYKDLTTNGREYAYSSGSKGSLGQNYLKNGSQFRLHPHIDFSVVYILLGKVRKQHSHWTEVSKTKPFMNLSVAPMCCKMSNPQVLRV